MNKKTMYVSLEFELHESKIEEHMLQVEIEEVSNDFIVLRAATMCTYFEEELFEMCKKYFADKDIKIGYRSDIPLKFYSYREFMNKIQI